MLTKLGELLFFIFALFAGINEIGLSGNDYKTYTVSERIEVFEKNQEAFEALVEYGFSGGADGHALSSFFTYNAAKAVDDNVKSSVEKISKMMDERVNVHYTEKDEYVVFEFLSGTEGYSGSGLYYSKNNIYMAPASGIEATYNEEADEYVACMNSSSVTVTKIADHWYLYQKANYKDEGFVRRK